MSYQNTVYRTLKDYGEHLESFTGKLRRGPQIPDLTGLCGFDGFVDTFIRMRKPASMAEFGPKVAAAAGVAASYSVEHQGDKFGGNGPLFACALHDLLDGGVSLVYAGGIGDGEPEPLFAEALEGKVTRMAALAPPAHSDCLEFTDGKVMLGDFRTCSEITLERLLSVMGEAELDALLEKAGFVSAVNWGKLPRVGEIWSDIPRRLKRLGREPKSVPFFMDLAEFEHREKAEIAELADRLPEITEVCTTLLSFNLKEAWQMGTFFGEDFQGRKEPEAVADLAAALLRNLAVDKVVIHPNDGAACASKDGVVYMPGPHCKDPLISTGAGDNFGAGCLVGLLSGQDDAGMLLTGNAASGFFVRAGRSGTLDELAGLVEAWRDGNLGERLP